MNHAYCTKNMLVYNRKRCFFGNTSALRVVHLSTPIVMSVASRASDLHDKNRLRTMDRLLIIQPPEPLYDGFCGVHPQPCDCISDGRMRVNNTRIQTPWETRMTDNGKCGKTSPFFKRTDKTADKYSYAKR